MEIIYKCSIESIQILPITFDTLSTEKEGKGTFELGAKAPDDYDPDKDDRFPFILTMCGSGSGFFKVCECRVYIQGCPLIQ